MKHNQARDQYSDGRGTIEARNRRRTRPMLMALEDRRLLSTFTVTDVADSGTGSLRYEIDQANTNAGPDAITFDSTLFSTPQTIALTSGQLSLSDAATTTIAGPGSGLLSISGNDASRVFLINYGSAALSGLTITGGSASTGGGLYNKSGTATLTDCTVSGNSANNGGGVFTRGVYNYYGGTYYGATTLTNCTISGNTAGSGGGGLYSARYGATALSNCTVSGNSASYNGGGMLTVGFLGYDGTTTMTNCTVSGNSAGNNGGGLWNYACIATVTGCTVSGNSAGLLGGGLYNRGGTTTLTGCTIVPTPQLASAAA